MTRHGQRGELDRKINAQISTAQYERLAEAAEQQRVNISTILRWLIDDHVGDYLTPRGDAEARKEATQRIRQIVKAAKESDDA